MKEILLVGAFFWLFVFFSNFLHIWGSTPSPHLFLIIVSTFFACQNFFFFVFFTRVEMTAENNLTDFYSVFFLASSQCLMPNQFFRCFNNIFTHWDYKLFNFRRAKTKCPYSMLQTFRFNVDFGHVFCPPTIPIIWRWYQKLKRLCRYIDMITFSDVEEEQKRKLQKKTVYVKVRVTTSRQIFNKANHIFWLILFSTVIFRSKLDKILPVHSFLNKFFFWSRRHQLFPD